MNAGKARRRPVESVRKRMIETYARRIARIAAFSERDFFDFRASRRGVETRFQQPL